MGATGAVFAADSVCPLNGYVFFSALVATAGAALGLIWWQQRARYYRGQAQAAEALRQSESKFKAVFENAPIGISLLDTERKLFELDSVTLGHFGLNYMDSFS